MKKLLSFLMCAGLASDGALAGPLDGLVVKVGAQPVVTDQYPERRTEFAGHVTGLADVVYSTPVGFRPLTLDLYLPPGAKAGNAQRYPVILYIHGGGWMAGHTRHAGAIANFPEFLASVAGRGYVVASVSYRLSGEAPFPAQGDDVKAAIRYLRNNADRYSVDPARFGIWGGSAGAHLAAYAATTCRTQAKAAAQTGIDGEGRPLLQGGSAQGSDCVQAAALWYGIFDLAKLRNPASPAPSGDPLTRLLGCAECAPSVVAAASPSTFVDAKTAPVLLVHGDADRLAPSRQSVEFDALLKKAGVHSELVLLPGVDHSMIGATPDKTREATLTSVSLTMDFFNRMLK